MTSFFEELKRRKVYRVAVAYMIAAGGIIQLSSAVFPAWELPNWTLRLTVVLLLALFPIALILAWAFDVTPGGIRRTPNLPSTVGGVPSLSHRRRNIFLVGLSGLILAAVAGFFLLPGLTATNVDKSIAVLPFENLSADPENAYFADGLQDDILTNLAKIHDLKVISRTSVMGYRGNTDSVREIGKALGVGAVLEGSVRRDRNRVRLNVQLIDTKTDQHLWAEDYDRELTDVFAIQTDLAERIAGELQAKLSPTEREQIMRKPTENGEAYLAYLQASSWHSSFDNLAKLKEAEQLYQRAIQLDPQFALALANLSILESSIFNSFEPVPMRAELARSYAQRALDLQPGLPEAHLARGSSLYYCDRDYNAALAELAIAQRALPNDSQINSVIGWIQRRQGRWQESTAHLEKAARLSPNDTLVLLNLALSYQRLRDFEAANRVIDRALAVEPRSFSLWRLKAILAINGRGDFSVAEKALDLLTRPDPEGEETSAGTKALLAFSRAGVFLLQDKYEESLATLQQLNDETVANQPGGLFDLRFLTGVAERKLGHEAEAEAAFTSARELAERDVRAAPDDAGGHARLALVLAHLAKKEAAIAEAERARELLPESIDAYGGVDITATAAAVYALTGENTKAIELLKHLLSQPSDVTVISLPLDSAMDGLRDDPRFQQMLQKHEQNA